MATNNNSIMLLTPVDSIFLLQIACKRLLAAALHIYNASIKPNVAAVGSSRPPDPKDSDKKRLRGGGDY